WSGLCPGWTACRRDMVRPPLDPLRVPLTELEDEGGGRGGQCAAGPARWPRRRRGPAGGACPVPGGVLRLFDRAGGCAVRAHRCRVVRGRAGAVAGRSVVGPRASPGTRRAL